MHPLYDFKIILCFQQQIAVQDIVKVLDGKLYRMHVVHDLGHNTSGSPSSSGAVNTKAVASVPTLTLLTLSSSGS